MFDGWRCRVKALTKDQQQASGQMLAGWLTAVRTRFARIKTRDDVGVEVIDRLSLGGRKSLLLVALDHRRFVVAVSGEQVPAVTELSHTSVGDISFGHSRIRWSGKRLADKRVAR